MADQPRIISRRDLLRGAAAVGAAAAAPVSGIVPAEAVAPAAAAQAAQGVRAPMRRREAYEHLTAAEADVIEAIADRLIPSDDLGPGAVQAGAVLYIDRGLGGALASSRDAYRAGLGALDRYCRLSRGAPFIELSTTDQDSVLIDVQTGSATGSGAGFTGSSAGFFNLVKGHVWQGMFGDPFYGGNADFVGWDLLRYPGVRTIVSAADQERLERGELEPNHRSAYDNDMFHKATADAGRPGGHAHGD